MKDITFKSVVNIYVRHFQYCGILPFEGKNFDSFLTRSLRLLLQSNMLIFLSMYWISMIIETEKVLTNGTYWLENISIHFATLQFYTIVSKRNGYQKVLNLCQDIWNQLNENERTNVTFCESKLRIMYRICFVGMATSLAGFLSAPIYLNSTGDSGSRYMPFQILLSIQNSPWYEIIFVVENVLSIFVLMVTTSYIIGLPVFYIIMICGLLRTVRHRLVRLENTVRFSQISRHELKARLLKIIKFHNEVLSLFEEIKYVVESLFFAQIPFVLALITLSLYEIVKSTDDRNKIIMTPLLGIFISFGFNFVPELLIGQSRQLSKAISMPYLISGDKETNQILLIFNSRIQKTLQLQAGGLYILSIEFFGKILYRSFSFFNVLRNST